jgi:hypothetical protein
MKLQPTNYSFMYKFFLFCLVVLLYTTHAANAQYENVWTFGQRAGIDFNSGNPVAIQSAMTMDGWGESAASVCNAEGRLLFYTDGTLVWNKNGEVMPNGRYLCGTRFTLSTSSTAQGTIIIPKPGAPYKYYVFSLTPYEYFQAGYPSMYGSLFYSIVDMKLSNDLGDVTTEKAVVVDSFLYEGMTAVRGEQCNFWLIVYDRIAIFSFKRIC